MHPDLGEPLEHLGLELEPEDNETTSLFLQSFGEDVFYEARVNVTALLDQDLRCGGLVLATNLTMVTLVELTDDCMLQKCSFRDGGPEVCPPDYKESDDRTFWIYFSLRFLGTISLTSGVTMLDPIALNMIRKYGGHFGRERLFSTLGMAFFSPLVGLCIDRNSHKKGAPLPSSPSSPPSSTVPDLVGPCRQATPTTRRPSTRTTSCWPWPPCQWRRCPWTSSHRRTTSSGIWRASSGCRMSSSSSPSSSSSATSGASSSPSSSST